MTLLDRQRGCLIGLAVGDSLGAAVEFMLPGSFEPVSGYRAGGPHRLNPGEWTDDTSMALALADSIGEVGWNLQDQAQRYVRWWRTGAYSVNGRCFDIGNATRDALARFERTQDAKRSGSSDSRSSGNGSIMRLAPVSIRYVDLFPDRIVELARLAAESSLPTHASPQCLSACRYLAILLAGLMHGVDREEVLSPDWEPLRQLRQSEPLHPEVDTVASGSFRELEPPHITGSGYVVKSLEAALWAFHKARDFRESVLKAVNLGNDADTTGAVCGQIAGACWGESGIPPSWLAGLAQRQLIEQPLSQLLSGAAQESAIPPPNASSYWVVPGRFLAGAYPGAATPDAHRKKLASLIDAGIRTFVNLMEADETNHAGQAFTPYQNDLRGLCPDVGCLRFPIPDLSVPTVTDMDQILNAIDQSLAADKPVYLHCWGGVGRTGTVVGCWLIRHDCATPEDVLSKLATLRRQDRERGNRESPETAAQRDFVLEWQRRRC